MMADADVQIQALTFRKYADGETHTYDDLKKKIFTADHSHKCPPDVNRPPRAKVVVRREKMFVAGCRSSAAWNSRPKVVNGRNMLFVAQPKQTPFRP